MKTFAFRKKLENGSLRVACCPQEYHDGPLYRRKGKTLLCFKVLLAGSVYYLNSGFVCLFISFFF